VFEPSFSNYPGPSSPWLLAIFDGIDTTKWREGKRELIERALLTSDIDANVENDNSDYGLSLYENGEENESGTSVLSAVFRGVEL